jgi:hypothetical protein
MQVCLGSQFPEEGYLKEKNMSESQTQGTTQVDTAQKDKSSAVQRKYITPIKWQERLLPLMSRMIIGLTIFFFVASFVQLVYLHWTISHGPRMDSRQISDIVSLDPNAAPEDVLAAARLKVLAALEVSALERRYHQANVLVMSSVWTRYLAFVTGMILALVGSSFILGKLQEPASEMIGRSGVAEFSFRSTSPGIILAGLGVILMITTLVMRHETIVTDRATFMSLENVQVPLVDYSTRSTEEPSAPYRFPESTPEE